jgi:hypothetical protein
MREESLKEMKGKKGKTVDTGMRKDNRSRTSIWFTDGISSPASRISSMCFTPLSTLALGAASIAKEERSH